MSEDNNNESEPDVESEDVEEEPSNVEGKSQDTESSEGSEEGGLGGLSDGTAIAIGILAIFVLVGGLFAASTTLGPGSNAQFDYDAIDGAEEDGITNNTQIINSHVRFLTQQSYTIEDVSSSTNETVTVTYQYDNNARIGYTAQNVQDGVSNEVYENFSSRQRFIVESLGAENQNYSRTFITRATPFVADTRVFRVLATTNLTVDRVVQGPNGESVAVYEVQSVRENFTDQLDIEGEVHLSQEGYVRLIDIRVGTVQNGTVVTNGTQELEVTDVGSTTVGEPDWLSEARQQTEEAERPEPPQNSNITVQPQNETEG